MNEELLKNIILLSIMLEVIMIAVIIVLQIRIYKYGRRVYFVKRDRERCNELLYSAKDGYFCFVYPDQKVKDPQKTLVEKCSRRLAVMLNLKNGTASSFEDILDSFYKDDVRLLKKYVSLLQQEGLAFEDVLTVKGGHRYVGVYGSRVHGADKNLYCDVVWFRDITAEAEKIAALENEQQEVCNTLKRFENMIDGLNYPVWIRDEQLNLLAVNKKYAEYCGQSNKETAVNDHIEICNNNGEEVCKTTAALAQKSKKMQHGGFHRVMGGKLYNFEVFTRLTDNIEYLVYSNHVSVKNDKKEYYNLQIMRILDNKIIKTLVGHNNKTTVIRYFSKDNKEEYILSCDISNLIIIWDIQYNYDIKYAIKEDRIDKEDIIYDSILLFNILGKNYISIPSYSEDKFTKLYEFNNNTPFIKNIYKTKNNKTLYMIPWLYKNNYYIIECCENKLSISNILEDKLYAKLYLKKDGMPLSGYLYKDNYLIVSDGNNNYIRIWDLINKIQIKKIDTESVGREIVPWNSSYVILACYKNIKIIDLEEEKIISEIEDAYAYGLKKIKISQYGECLVTSNSSNIIKFYSP